MPPQREPSASHISATSPTWSRHCLAKGDTFTQLLEQMGNWGFQRRISVSRGFMLVFLLLFVSTTSEHQGTMLASILLCAGLFLVGIALAGRLWCSLYISGRKDSELVTTGPYSMCRNPLYFFSLLGFAGIGLATQTLTLTLFMVGAFLRCYPSVIRREEESLRGIFKTQFDAYCSQTPRLFPRWSMLKESESYVVNGRLFRRTMGDAVWFIWCVGMAHVVNTAHSLHWIEPWVRLP